MAMRYRILLVFVAALLGAQTPVNQAAAAPGGFAQPRLVLGIVVDQFRYDYLTRFEGELTGGLRRLLDQGAVFTNANYDSAPTETAVGHSTFMSGATPSVSGIIANTWYSREDGRPVLSITDDSVAVLGGAGDGASPRRLLTSTIPDELKLSGKGGKVVSVSLKNRAAILMAGHMADGAYWFDGRGNFVSSSYYFDQLPSWVTTYDAGHPADAFAGKHWAGGTLPAPPGLYGQIDASPFGDELVHDFALRALEAEQLGTTPGKTDMLLVSYSSVDYVGHAVGPDSPEMHEMVLHVDRLIGELLAAAERRAGAGNMLAVFTADHGVAPVPEENVARRLPGGRIDARATTAAVEAALRQRFGDGDFFASASANAYYFNPQPIPGKSIDRAEMERVAAGALLAQPHVARVYTRSQLRNGSSGDAIDRRVRNGFMASRSPDVIALFEPYWQTGRSGTGHGTPYSYDTHVPIVFLGPPPAIEPGAYHGEAGVQDIAPTLAVLLGIATPSGSVGRVLDEILPAR